MIEKFAGYGFNKSHSTAYALIAYMTAYLKAHYPVEFMAALLSSDIRAATSNARTPWSNTSKTASGWNIEVVPPDVNRSSGRVHRGRRKDLLRAVGHQGLRQRPPPFAIAAGRGCRRALPQPVRLLRTGRPGHGQPLRRSRRSSRPGRSIRWGPPRTSVAAVIDRAMQSGAAAAADRRSGQMGLFGAEETTNEQDAAVNLPDVPEWERARRSWPTRRKSSATICTSHPLAEHENMLETYCTHTTTRGGDPVGHRTEVVLGGMLSAIKHSHTKNPKPGSPSRYAMFDLEDTAGMIRCILWPDGFVQYGEMVQPDAILVARGAIDKRPGTEEANLIINELIRLDELESRYTRGVVIRVIEQSHGQQGLEQLHDILRGYPGDCEVQLMLCLADGSRVPCKCDRMRVEINAEMRGRVAQLLGPDNLRLLISQPRATAGRANGRGNGRSRGR